MDESLESQLQSSQYSSTNEAFIVGKHAGRRYLASSSWSWDLTPLYEKKTLEHNRIGRAIVHASELGYKVECLKPWNSVD